MSKENILITGANGQRYFWREQCIAYGYKRTRK